MNNYYCVLPFYSVETAFEHPNKNIFCCRLEPNSDIEEVRESIRCEQRSTACSTCWQLEDAGMRSERQVHNETMDFLLDLSIENIENASITKGFSPVNIKLATSNLCNGTCVTCSSTCSSAWASLENKSSKYKGMDFDQIDFNIDWANIVSLSLVGGEPLLEKKNFQILETLLENKNYNCFISFVTNGSVELTAKQIELLKHFKNLNICLSIDGTGSVFEYMRYPLKWDRLVHNMGLFKQLGADVSVSCMISNLNIYYYSDMIDFFNKHNLNYLCKQVLDPYMFNPSNLPNEAKARVIKNNPAYQDEVTKLLNMYEFNTDLYLQFQKEIVRQDQLKNINIVDYMYLL